MTRGTTAVPAFLRSDSAALKWLVAHGTSLATIESRFENTEWTPETVIGEIRAIAENAYRRRKLQVYRAVKIDAHGEIDALCLGIYWSFEHERAAVYWGEGRGATVIIEGVVRPRDVDWESTLQAAVLAPGEYEITLHDDSPVLFKDPFADEYDVGTTEEIVHGMTGNHLGSSKWRKGCASSEAKTRAAWARWDR